MLLLALVDHLYFNLLVVAVTLTSIVFMFATVFEIEAPTLFDTVDVAVLIFYVCEGLLRIIAMGPKVTPPLLW